MIGQLICAISGHLMGRAVFNVDDHEYKGYACERCGRRQLLLRPGQHTAEGVREELEAPCHLVLDCRNGREAAASSAEEAVRMRSAITRANGHGPSQTEYHPEYIRTAYRP